MIVRYSLITIILFALGCRVARDRSEVRIQIHELTFGAFREIVPLTGDGGNIEVRSALKDLALERAGAVNQIIEIHPPNNIPQNLGRLMAARYGRFWRDGDEVLSLSYRERMIKLAELKAVRTLKELEALLGYPPRVYGPLDGQGSHIWRWRFCNGRRGMSFEGVEILAGRRSQDETVHFLAFRIARPVE